MTLADYLRAEGAANDVVSWASSYAHDMQRALDECPRGDWLLAIAVRLGAPRSEVLQAACACARDSIDLATPGDLRPRAALEHAESLAAGRGELSGAMEADAERAVDEALAPEGASAALAALAALRGARDLSEAPLAAAASMQAQVLSAGECAHLTIASYAAKRCAEHVRGHVTLTALRLPPS